MSIRASVIIPTHNKCSRLHFTLMAFSYQEFDEFEVVVCDDGSTDGTQSMLEKLDTPYRLRIVPGRHAGAAAARNRAVECAAGKVLIFNDDDMVPAPNFVAEHVRVCEVTEVLSRGQRWSVPIELVSRYLGIPVERKTLLDLWQNTRLTVAEDWAFYALNTSPMRHYRFLQVCTSNLAIRKDLFDRIGGFEESFGITWGAEDTEFGYRAQKHGIDVHLCPCAYNLHLEHSTDSGRKFERGLKNFRRFSAMYPMERDVQALLHYLEVAVAEGNAAELFDEQSFVTRPAPDLYHRIMDAREEVR